MGPNYSVVLCVLQELFFLFLSGGSFLGLGLFSVRKARSALSQRVRVTPLQIFGAHCLCSSLLYGTLLSKLCGPSGSPNPSTQWDLQALCGFCLQSVSWCSNRTYLLCYPSLREYSPILPVVQCVKTCFIYIVWYSSCLGKKGKSGLCHSVLEGSKITLWFLNFNNFVITSNFLPLLYPQFSLAAVPLILWRCAVFLSNSTLIFINLKFTGSILATHTCLMSNFYFSRQEIYL